MCGLGIKLGNKKPPVPQAAHHLAEAILDDLEPMDKKKKAKQEVMGTPSVEDEDGNDNDSEMVAENSLWSEQSEELDTDDAITSQAIYAEERKDVSTCTALRPDRLLFFRLSFCSFFPNSASYHSRNTLGEHVTMLRQETMK